MKVALERARYVDTLAEYESLYAGCDRTLAEYAYEIGSESLREPTRAYESLPASTRGLCVVYKKT